MDCLWSIWSEWAKCSKTCGDGVRKRVRHVQTSAQNGGLPCSGSEMQAESCNDQDCPGNKFKRGSILCYSESLLNVSLIT